MNDACEICLEKFIIDKQDNKQICILRTSGFKRSTGLCFICQTCILDYPDDNKYISFHDLKTKIKIYSLSFNLNINIIIY